MFIIGFFMLLVLLGIYSYGFVDPNLHLTNNALFINLQKPLSDLVYHNMKLAGFIYVVLTTGLYLCYLWVLKHKKKDWKKLIVLAVTVLLFSFPSFTYDIFNYITTARVAYTHHENPYLVMPVEIPNEPALAYTRAANKYALYGPTWLLLTWIPHTFGQNNIWLTILSFKTLIAVFYILMLGIIYRLTKSIQQVLFFGLNPLVLIEVLLAGHNDIVMMVLALLALTSANNWVSVVSWLASAGVKGATVVLAPLVFGKTLETEQMYKIAYWMMFVVFVFVAPLREELYPWYAVWFLTFAAVIPITKRSFIHGFTIALCMGLSMRHFPYILTREYGGWGPMLRMLLTGIPVVIYTIWFILPKIKRS